MNQHPVNAGTPISMRSWVWSQHWSEMLFLHWRVDQEVIQDCLPDSVTVATCDGSAWVSLVLFRLRVRPRWLPFVPWLSNLTEVNVRTYVTCHGQPGIWFLSIHADNRPAMALARMLTPLPYQYAAMQYECMEESRQFRAQTNSCGLHCELTFCPDGNKTECRHGSLDEWLLERYRLFIDSDQNLMRAEVTHPKWLTENVTVDVTANDFGRDRGLKLPGVPDLAHFSQGVRALFGRFQKLPLTESHEPPRRCFPRTEPVSESPRPHFQSRPTTLPGT